MSDVVDGLVDLPAGAEAAGVVLGQLGELALGAADLSLVAAEDGLVELDELGLAADLGLLVHQGLLLGDDGVALGGNGGLEVLDAGELDLAGLLAVDDGDADLLDSNDGDVQVDLTDGLLLAADVPVLVLGLGVGVLLGLVLALNERVALGLLSSLLLSEVEGLESALLEGIGRETGLNRLLELLELGLGGQGEHGEHCQKLRNGSKGEKGGVSQGQTGADANRGETMGSVPSRVGVAPQRPGKPPGGYNAPKHAKESSGCSNPSGGTYQDHSGLHFA